jgi:hypothetical protein
MSYGGFIMNRVHLLFIKKTKVLVFGLMFLMIGACGGGGGDGDDNGSSADTSQPLSLNSSNARAVSGLVVDTSMGGLTAGSLGNVVVASANTSNSSNFGFDILKFTQSLLDQILSVELLDSVYTSSVSRAQVIPDQNCSGGGRVFSDWTDQDQSQDLSVGDRIIISFSNCFEEGLLFNGDIEVGVLSMNGDPSGSPPWDLIFRLNFETLRASESGYTIEVVGSLDVTVDAPDQDTIIIDVTTEVGAVFGDTASSFLYFGEGYDFTELTLFSIHMEENSDGSFLMYCQGKLESSFIGGTVSFETTKDLSGIDLYINNPSDGGLLIIGAGNSSILLRVLANGNVELDVDDEGDGFDGGDVTIVSNWDELIDAADAL